MSTSGKLSDQDYVVLADGTILTVHGDNHPAGFFVGEITFVPDEQGGHTLLGNRYRKAHQVDGVTIREALRPSLRDSGSTPFHTGHLYSAKSVVRRDRIVKHIESASFPDLAPRGPLAEEYARETMAEVWRRFGTDLEGISIGLTGSPRLSSETDAKLHDLDIVFRGSVHAIRALVSSMASSAREDPSIRLIEFGKSWQIRLSTPSGVICSFFSYADPAESPLAGLTKMETMISDVILEGRVVEDQQNSFHPAILLVEPETWSTAVTTDAATTILVMINHLRGRGDFFVGDRAVFRGALVSVSSSAGDFLALSVIDGHSCVSLSPPWPDYDDAVSLLSHPGRGSFRVD